MIMKVKVELEVEIDGEYNEEDLQDYLAFELGYNGEISMDNPLCKDDVGYEVTYFDIKKII